MKRQRAERGGRRAEALAAFWLQLRGWTILGRRARTPLGEVDLIARRGAVLVFVEVKARANQAQADLSLDHFRLRRVAAAAEALAPRFARANDDIRIDAIYITPWRLPRHVANVWHG